MCNHPNLVSTARVDYCPDCEYEFYYGDAHAEGPASETRLVNRGGDTHNYGIYDRDNRSNSEGD